ncbi:phosphoglycerate mutase [Flavobacteriaceae bacterium AU392]|nr:phosphoglycerate mutase [Flavobacteriaceae bacterium]RKM86083.1 phosphoglycerate mutase [Flavobacteriaceae bacterium AU392]
MRHLFIFTLIVLLATPAFSQQKENTETSTFYFIRHAEKDRSDAKNRNPNLIEKGLLRAAKWSKVLENVKFDNVYSTNYNRTKQTALPTAEKNNLEITLYDPRNIDGSAFIKNNKGKTVLVVGHSNTTPAFVNAVIGSKKYKNIDDSNNANLYIVTIFPNGNLSDTMLVID